MIEQDSYSYDKEGVDKVGEIIRNYAQAQGWNIHVEQFEKAGNGLLITMNDNAPMLPVAFTGHMDTVFPRGTFAKPMFREENGRFYGPGVFDMKGSIVMALLDNTQHAGDVLSRSWLPRHSRPSGKPGNHGSDCAQDLNILHYFGAIRARDPE